MSNDNELSVVGDRSYIVQDTSMSEMEVSLVIPMCSPIRYLDYDDDCASPQQIEEVNSTSCSAVKANDDQHMATNSIPQSAPVSDAPISTINVGNQVPWSRFKIVIDNIDKNFRLSYQRFDHQTKSLHCVHMFASKDRINLSSFSNSKPQQVSVMSEDILPSCSELADVKQHFKVLVSRFVFSYMYYYNVSQLGCLCSVWKNFLPRREMLSGTCLVHTALRWR